MRLSDIKGERVFDVIAEVIDPIANIAGDSAAADLFTRRKLPEGMTPKAFLLDRARESVPALLKGHKGDVIAILAAIDGVTPEEYVAALDLVKLTQDFADLLTDDAFKTLFISAQSGNGSGSAQESTEAPKA